MHFATQDLNAQDCYRLLVSGVIPRPIAWISTVSAEGVGNLAPYSFFTVASCYPPVLSITQVNPRDKDAKDTLANLNSTGVAVVNIVSADLVDSMNASCANYPPQVSEFDALGIAATPHPFLPVAGVSAARLRYGCRLRELIEVAPGAAGGTMILLDVVDIFVQDDIISDMRIHPAALDAVGKLGDDYYSTVRDTFELARPRL